MRPLGPVLHAAALSLALAAPLAPAQSERQDAMAIQGRIQASLAEVEAGRLASQKAQDPEVRKFAERMVEQHGRQLQDLQRMAESKGVAAPNKPSGAQQAMLSELRAASGAQFDAVYMAQRAR